MSAAFLSDLEVEFVDGDTWLLVAPLVYRTGDGLVITCPAGTTTDFASTPRVLWWRYPKSGPWAPAAAVHDGLYRGTAVVSSARVLARVDADRVLREAMATLGISARTRLEFYWAVRVGGGRAWSQPRAAQTRSAANRHCYMDRRSL